MTKAKTETKTPEAATITRGELLAMLAIASQAVSHRSTLPSLQYVLIESDHLTATDLETFMRVSMPANSTGSLLLPAGQRTCINLKELQKVVKALDDDKPVQLATDNQELRDLLITQQGDDTTAAASENFSARLFGMSVKEFPGVNRMLLKEGKKKLKPFATLKVVDLMRALKRVMPFASTDPNRHNICSLLFEPDEKGSNATVNIVTTDGRRLRIDAVANQQQQQKKRATTTPREKALKGKGEKTVTAGSPDKNNPLSILIPRDAMAKLGRMLALITKKNGETGFAAPLVTMTVDDKKKASAVLFECGSIQTTICLLDGVFPDYRKVTPSFPYTQGNLKIDGCSADNSDTVAFVCDRASLSQAIVKASSLLTERHNALEWEVVEGQYTKDSEVDYLRLTGKSPEKGSVVTSLPVVVVGGSGSGVTRQPTDLNFGMALEAVEHIPHANTSQRICIILNGSGHGSAATSFFDVDDSETGAIIDQNDRSMSLLMPVFMGKSEDRCK
jgi:DNA polymerase III sliding clamp (beta) subunit (PCNA family)